MTISPEAPPRRGDGMSAAVDAERCKGLTELSVPGSFVRRLVVSRFPLRPNMDCFPRDKSSCISCASETDAKGLDPNPLHGKTPRPERPLHASLERRPPETDSNGTRPIRSKGRSMERIARMSRALGELLSNGIVSPICATVLESSTDAVLARMAEVSPRADVIEVRADGVQEGLDLEAIVARRPRPIVLTCRPVREGGLHTGSEEERLSLLEKGA